jgi:hypothetical protein
MFKKTITFTDFNDEKRTQDFYFNMSKADFLVLAADGDAFMARLQRIIATKDNAAIMAEFTAIIKAACGMRSEDGSRFLKTPEAQSALLDSGAFDELLIEMCTDANAASEFINQLFPKKMAEEMAEQLKKQQKEQKAVDPFVETDRRTHSREFPDNAPLWMKENRTPTQTELMNMTPAELQEAFRQRAATQQ